MSDLIEAVFRAAIRAVVEMIGFYTAKILLPIISFGTIRAGELCDDLKFGWFPFWRWDEKHIVIHSDVAAALGVFVWIVVLVALVALWH